jgi:hypothetical protein
MTAFLLLRIGTDKHPFTAFCSADVVAKNVRKPSYWQAVAVVRCARRLFFCLDDIDRPESRLIYCAKNSAVHGPP